MDENKIYHLPIAAGTVVYVVESCYCSSHYAEHHCRLSSNSTHKNATAIAVIRLPEKHKGQYRIRCAKIYERPFDPVKHLSKWGKSAFATPDEAIAAAKRSK